MVLVLIGIQRISATIANVLDDEAPAASHALDAPFMLSRQAMQHAMAAINCRPDAIALDANRHVNHLRRRHAQSLPVRAR